MGEVLIRAENVGKIFCRDFKRSLYYGLRDSLGEVHPVFHRKEDASGTPKLRKDEFWANQGINFELRRGECLGLIGHNGAGKTTLLKMLNGLIKPDTGRIEMNGRVGALIALGAGFTPLLTARENIYLNGSILGMSQQAIRERFDEIVAFAEIEDFVDAPLQNFSSGMQVRLGFAIATILEPDVLLLDEVLAVGDRQFRNKSLLKISEYLKRSAVIFVSHQENQVRRICDRLLWLDRGTIREQGITDEVMPRFLEAAQQQSKRIGPQHHDTIAGITLTDTPETGQVGNDLRFGFRVSVNQPLRIDTLQINFFQNGDIVAQCLMPLEHESSPSAPLRVEATLKQLRLSPGDYEAEIMLTLDGRKVVCLLWHNAFSVKILGDTPIHAPYLLEGVATTADR